MSDSSLDPERRLEQLQQENQALRNQIDTQLHTERAFKSVGRTVGSLRRIGRTGLCGMIAVLVLGLCLVYPPWMRVRSQRQQVLYWSRWVKDYESEFAGYGHTFSEAGQHEDWPKNPVSESFFDVTEYRIHWPLLIAEWAVICGLIAGGAHVVRKRRAAASVKTGGLQDHSDSG